MAKGPDNPGPMDSFEPICPRGRIAKSVLDIRIADVDADDEQHETEENSTIREMVRPKINELISLGKQDSGRTYNENFNDLVRQYLPKRKSQKYVTQDDCNAIARQLNDRPRKRLGYRSPREVLFGK